MISEWLSIDEFPTYSVSTMGQVRNDETGHIMAMLRTQSGLVHVGLTKDRKLHKRSVPLLVATHFLVPPRHITFTTPINLDGNRLNNSVDNLVWRPKWFAARYHMQFGLADLKPIMAVEDIDTGTIYKSTWDAVVTHGLVDDDIRIATKTGLEVWPTFQRFRALE